MKSNIREISLEPANAGVIECLEGALKLAHEGKLSMVAIASVERDGHPHNWHSEMHNRSLMIGAVTRMQHDLLHEADE